MNPRSDHDLLRRLKLGDQQAWTEFTREYGARVYNYLLSNLPSQEDVQDVLNETMFGAVKAVQKFDGKASLSTLVFKIAKHKLADFYRKHQNTLELLDTVPENSNSNAGSTERIEFLEALEGLPEASREALLLRYQVGLSVGEVAQVMERSYKGVESLLSRAREQLRKILGGDDDDDGDDDD